MTRGILRNIMTLAFCSAAKLLPPGENRGNTDFSVVRKNEREVQGRT